MIKRVIKNLKKVSVADIGMIKLGVLFFTLWLASYIPQIFLVKWRWPFFAVFIVLWILLAKKFTSKK